MYFRLCGLCHVFLQQTEIARIKDDVYVSLSSPGVLLKLKDFSRSQAVTYTVHVVIAILILS